MTENGTRITVRVRRTEGHCSNEDDPENHTTYEAATKYRLPYDPKSMTSRCIELEKIITPEEYEMALPFGERLYQKRRFIFPLIHNFIAELDWYVDKSTGDFARYCKMDINTSSTGLRPGQIVTLLKSLPEKGIIITDLINPPWVHSPKVKERISDLMEKQWNLV